MPGETLGTATAELAGVGPLCACPRAYDPGTATVSRHRRRCKLGLDRSPFFDSVAQGLGKANLMAVRIGQVEVALTPFGVLRRGVRVEFAASRRPGRALRKDARIRARPSDISQRTLPQVETASRTRQSSHSCLHN